MRHANKVTTTALDHDLNFAVVLIAGEINNHRIADPALWQQVRGDAT
jgi:hypothetical protein